MFELIKLLLLQKANTQTRVKRRRTCDGRMATSVTVCWFRAFSRTSCIVLLCFQDNYSYLLSQIRKTTFGRNTRNWNLSCNYLTMSASLWKRRYAFNEDRLDKPRRFGVTEIPIPNFDPFSHTLLRVTPFPFHFITLFSLQFHSQSWLSITTIRYHVPYVTTLILERLLQDIFESRGDFVDGLKLSGGSYSLMPTAIIKQVIDLAHQHGVYVSTGDWDDRVIPKTPSGFKKYVEVSARLMQ